jgi:hypothetical protein
MALQGRISNTQLLDCKSLFWSILLPHKVWAWSFSALCICRMAQKKFVSGTSETSGLVVVVVVFLLLFYLFMLNIFLVCLTSSWMKLLNFSLCVTFCFPYRTVLFPFFSTAYVYSFVCVRVCVCVWTYIKPSKHQCLMAERL